MCLGHVYIVLEPVGSARLKFGDDRYYEFLCFDVPKVVRSPGYDHRHDEESRNGRDVKINILDDYIRISERFRVVPVFFRVPGSYRNMGEEVYGPYWALVERREKEQGGGRRPREDRRARRGSPTPTGSRTPPFLVGIGEGKGEGERRKGGAAPLSLSYLD